MSWPSRRVLLGASLATLSTSCGVLYGSHALRYRLSCTLERDGVSVRGQSVLGIQWTNTGPAAGFDGIDRFETAAWGDAIII
jgi:hypothetical protein